MYLYESCIGSFLLAGFYIYDRINLINDDGKACSIYLFSKVNRFYFLKKRLQEVQKEYFLESVDHRTYSKEEDSLLLGMGRSVEHYEGLIRAYTNEMDVVLDLFAGGGSCGVAAMSLGRKYVGCEIEGDRCEFANKRIEGEIK